MSASRMQYTEDPEKVKIMINTYPYVLYKCKIKILGPLPLESKNDGDDLYLELFEGDLQYEDVVWTKQERISKNNIYDYVNRM